MINWSLYNICVLGVLTHILLFGCGVSTYATNCLLVIAGQGGFCRTCDRSVQQDHGREALRRCGGEGKRLQTKRVCCCNGIWRTTYKVSFSAAISVAYSVVEWIVINHDMIFHDDNCCVYSLPSSFVPHHMILLIFCTDGKLSSTPNIIKW